MLRTPATARRALCPLLATVITALPLTLSGCDRTESAQKTTTTRTSQTPEGTKQTTETTTKKVETQPR